MNEPKNLTKTILYAIEKEWWVIVFVVVIPITFAILMKKFEKWAEKKIKNIKKKKVKDR
jgi:hypothetical protein